MTTERSATKLVCDGKCVPDAVGAMGALYKTELQPINAVIRSGRVLVGLRCEYRSGWARKFTNILGEYCPFCGGKTP